MGSPVPAQSPVLTNYDGPIATITLNRPNHLNALNSQGFDGFADALVSINQRDDIVITGKRYAFVVFPFVLFTQGFMKFCRLMEDSSAQAHRWTGAVKRRSGGIRARKAIVVSR